MNIGSIKRIETAKTKRSDIWKCQNRKISVRLMCGKVCRLIFGKESEKGK